jgi:hypothetical protein
VSRLSKPLAAAALALVLAATPAKAQLWYNGNWNGTSTMLPSERDLWVPDTRIYDDFLVTGGGWNVTTLFGDFLSSLTPTQAYWEIRSGVSAGNGGSLLYSGTSSISWLLLGPGLWGDDNYRATIGGLNLTLPAGTYWMSIAPVESAWGRAYAVGTNGSGGVNPLLDGNSYWDSQTFGKNFVATSSHFGRNTDFAYGVGGTALSANLLEQSVIVNPEPGTLVLLATGLGLLGLGVLRRRRVARA